MEFSDLVPSRLQSSNPGAFAGNCAEGEWTYVRDFRLLTDPVFSFEVVSLCACLGEYPVIRYYKPRAPTHEASVLCSHLARFIQDELDRFAQFQKDFPPNTNRPRGILLVVDRSLDMFSPLLHEFTYQAMAHDLLPIKDGDKVTYETVINEGTPNEEVKEMEIGEKDRVWVDYRHAHMKDVLERIGDDFAKFRAANSQFDE